MLLLFFGLVLYLRVPRYERARASNEVGACKANLKQLGAAMEMYSAEWGAYPPRGKAQLTPRYLEALPECAPAGADTYVVLSGQAVTYNTQSLQDYFFIYCSGENHAPVGIPSNYPQYSSLVGCIER